MISRKRRNAILDAMHAAIDRHLEATAPEALAVPSDDWPPEVRERYDLIQGTAEALLKAAGQKLDSFAYSKPRTPRP